MMQKKSIISQKTKKRNLCTRTRVFSSILITTLAIIFALNHDYVFSKFSTKGRMLKYWGLGFDNTNTDRSLRSMNRNFERLNFEFIENYDYDIVWSIYGPGTSRYDKVKKFRKMQKINHFPGNSVLTVKSYMNAINSDLKYILPSFRLPYEQNLLNEYLSKHPEKLFVKKNMHNRGVVIVDVKDVKNADDEDFYQVFLDKPLLIDNHAFDLGIFVLITSVNPLRIYKYDQDILLRFCPKKYHPFNKHDVDKYVVKEGHKSTYEMKYFGDEFTKYTATFKDLFERYLQMNGKNVTKMWNDVDDAIVRILKNSEDKIVDELAFLSHSSHNFFELVRFDFMIDNDMNVYVMEVNMSPNMTPGEPRFERNAMIYEPMIYSAIQMVGGGNYYEFMSRFDNNSNIINNKHIASDIDNCLDYDCINNCDRNECQLCLPCLSAEMIYNFKEAHREFKYQGDFQRVFPKNKHFDDYEIYSDLSVNNHVMMKWYAAMCRKNFRMC